MTYTICLPTNALSQIDYGPIRHCEDCKEVCLWQRTTQKEFWKIRVGVCVGWVEDEPPPPPNPSPSFQNALPPLNKYSAFFLFRPRSQTWRLPDVSQQNRRLKRHLDLMKTKLSIQFRNVSKTRKPCEFAGVEFFKKNCSSEKERQICLNAFKVRPWNVALFLKLDGQIMQLRKEDKLKIMTNGVDVLII